MGERLNNITDVTKLHDLVSSYFNSTKAAFDEKKDGLMGQVTGGDGAGDEAEDEGSNDARLYDASLEIPAPGILTTGHMVGFVASAALIALLGLGALRLARRPDNSQSLMSRDSED